MEAGLGLEHHRQGVRHLWQLARREQLAAERAHGQLQPTRRSHLRRPRAAGDHEHVAGHGLGVDVLTHLDAQLERAAHELAGDRRRVGDSVGGAEDRPGDVVVPQAVDERRVDPLDGHPELLLQHAPLLELGEPLLGRREEEVADLIEQRRAELFEEADAGLREPNLGRGGELLPHPAHRLCRRASGDLAAVGQQTSRAPSAARW